MKKSNSAIGVIKIIFPLFLVPFILIIGVTQGSAEIEIMHIAAVIANKLTGVQLPPYVTPETASIIWSIRLPRVLMAFLTGCAVAASGTIMQSTLKNPLASPYTMGVSAGASLGAAIVIITGISIPIIGGLTLPAMGMIFGFATVWIVVAMSMKVDRNLSGFTVVLVGMVFSLFVNALLTVLTAMVRSKTESITLWQMGSFSMRGWSHVGLLLPFLLIGTIGATMLTREMDAMTFGDEQALSLGVDIISSKRILFILSAILAGSAVSICGVVGFVDLISPHVARRYYGSRHILVLPVSMLTGGCIMVLSDLIARTIIRPAELPVGAITALIGAPFFAYVYFSKRK